jgi:hypothetical protein
MSTSEKFCLKWNDFVQNITSSFGDLRSDTDFTDVTLICRDGQPVQAHRVILAAASPFFQNILKMNKHPNPFIYMRGLKSSDLAAILDFLYYGEANVYEENVDGFLALAEELQLKGLTASDTGETSEAKVKETITKPSQQKPLKGETMNSNNINRENNFKSNQDLNVERSVALMQAKVSVDIQGLDEMIQTMITKSESVLGGIYGNLKATVCKVCGKEGVITQIKDHIEAHHIESVLHTCNICGKASRSRSALRMHKSAYHKK